MQSAVREKFILKKYIAFALLILCDKSIASSIISIDDASLEYEIRGNGKTVVLFDAGALAGMSGWDSIWNDLPSDITAIRFSRLGEGKSDPCKEQRSKMDYVEEVKKLTTKLDVRSPFVYVGHSLGGITARNFAAKYQGDVLAMLMIDPANPHDVDIIKQLHPKNGLSMINEVKRVDYDSGKGKWCFLDVIWDKSKAVGYEEIGDIPVSLLAAGKINNNSSNPLETKEGRQLWAFYQNEWVNKFPRGVFLVAKESSHFIQDDQPSLIIEELNKLLRQIKADKSHPPAL